MDSGYKVVVSLFLLETWRRLIENSYGRIIAELQQAFPGAKMTVLMASGSLFLTFSYMMTFIGLWISRLLGCRPTIALGYFLYIAGMFLTGFALNEYQLLIGYGFVCGLAGALLLPTGFFLTGQYFPPDHKRHVFMTSLMDLCSPVGSMLLPFTNVVMMLGWRQGYMLLTFILTVLAICACYVMKENRQETQKQPTAKVPVIKEHAVITTRLVICTISMVVFKFCMAAFIKIPMYILYKVATDMGHSINASGMLLVCLGAIKLVSRLGASVLGDRPILKNRQIHMYGILCLLSAIASGVFGLMAQTFWSLFIYTALIGLSSGALVAGHYAVHCYIFKQYANKVYSIGNIGSGFGIFLSLIICGLIYDISESFRFAFLFEMLLQVVACVCTLILIVCK